MIDDASKENILFQTILKNQDSTNQTVQKLSENTHESIAKLTACINDQTVRFTEQTVKFNNIEALLKAHDCTDEVIDLKELVHANAIYIKENTTRVSDLEELNTLRQKDMKESTDRRFKIVSAAFIAVFGAISATWIPDWIKGDNPIPVIKQPKEDTK